MLRNEVVELTPALSLLLLFFFTFFCAHVEMHFLCIKIKRPKIIYTRMSLFYAIILVTELALNTAQFAKSLAMLGSSEDNTALSRALSQLAEVEEKIEQLHQEQANSDFYLLAELLADYIRLLSVVRVSGLALHYSSLLSLFL